MHLGISAEPTKTLKITQLPRYEKDQKYVLTIYILSVCVYACLYYRSKDLIVRAINANDFLKNLEKVQVTEIVECMFPVEFKQDQFICREGAVGTELYVITGLDIMLCQ